MLNMDLETIGCNAGWFIGGGFAISATYLIWGMYRISKHENNAEYRELLDDYDKRILDLPPIEGIKLIDLYHSSGVIKKSPNEKNLTEIEDKLKSDLQKRKEKKNQEIWGYRFG